MPELHPGADLQQAGLGRWSRRLSRDSEPLSSPPHQHRIADRIGRRQPQRRRVCPGRVSSRRRKLSSIRSGSASALGSPNPPASSAGVSPRGSSSSASGLPRVSATIRSRTRASSGPASIESSNARALPSGKLFTTSSGNPDSSPPGARAANTNPTDSACRRRATNPRTCAEARSSHCSSSTRQISGWSSATSDSRPRTARPMKNRSGAGPALRPNAVRSALRCGSGKGSRRSSIGATS